MIKIKFKIKIRDQNTINTKIINPINISLLSTRAYDMSFLLNETERHQSKLGLQKVDDMWG